MKIAIPLVLLLSLQWIPAESKQTADPCPGSGGLWLGSPSKEDVDSGRLDFSPARFAPFKVHMTTKTNVVKTLGQPAGWRTNPDGSSQLEYDFVDRPGVLGMRQVMYAQFFFDPQMVLTRFTYPGFDSSIQPVNFDGKIYLNRTVTHDRMVYTPEGQGEINTWVDQITVDSRRLRFKGQDESIGDLLSREANHFAQVGRVLKQTLPASEPGTGDSEGLLVAVEYSQSYTDFVCGRFQQAARRRCTVTTYFHREYGTNSSQRIEAFIKLNQDRIQAAMTTLDGNVILTKPAGPPATPSR